MSISLKRIYDKPETADGFCILVERRRPRGVSKEKARVDLWQKQEHPSSELRRRFDHAPEEWTKFKRRYWAELKANEPVLTPIRESIAPGPFTFVFASRETQFNNAVALKQYLERASKKGRKA